MSDQDDRRELVPLQLTVNGRQHAVAVPPWTTLLDLLRERLLLTGAKKGCDHGQCGACTVLVNGRRMNACLILAVTRPGAEVITIEGLGDGDTPHLLQEAFVRHDAYQCGFCTPGQICSAAGLVAEGGVRTRAEVREAMSGNLCRCGAYPYITDAVFEVIKESAGR